MPHSFDTGLATPQRTLLRNAIVARLGALKKTGPAAGLYVTTVEGIVATLGSDDADIVFEAMNGQGTAILVGLGRKRYEPNGLAAPRDRYMATIDAHVYVISDNMRQPAVARLDGGATPSASNQVDPGIDTMLEHVEQLLLGHQVTDASSTVYQMIPVSEDEVGHFTEFTVWEQVYTVQVQREVQRDKGLTETFQSVDTRVGVPDVAAPAAQPLTLIPV